MTSRNKNVKYTLSYQVDQKSINQVEQSTSQLEQAADRTAQSFGVLGNSAQKAGQQLRSAFKDSGTGLLGKLRNEARDATKDTDKLRQSIAEVNRERSKTPTPTQTNFGQLKGGIGAVGGLANVAGIDVGAITGAAEALADVADNAPALKGNLISLATSMGPLGAAGIAAGAAVGGMLLVSNAMQKLEEEAKKAAEGIVNAAEGVANVTGQIGLKIVQGDMAGAFGILQQQFDQYRAALIEEASLRDQLAEAEAEQVRARREAGKTLGFQNENDDTRLADKVVEGLEESLRAFNDDTLTPLTGTLQTSARLLGVTDTSLEGIATALVPYNQELKTSTETVNAATTALLARSAAEGEFVRFQAQARQNTADQNKDLLASINTNKQAIETEIATLRQSGDTSEQTTQRIAQLETQLQELGRQAEFVTNTALPAAEAEERRNKALEDSKKALEETTEAENKANEERANAAKKYRDDLIALAKQTADASAAALKQSQQRLKDLIKSEGRQAEDERIAIERKSLTDRIAIQQQIADQDTAHLQKLEDIRKQASRSERKLASERNFAALYDLRQSTVDQMEDAETARQREQDAFKQSLEQQRIDQQLADQFAAEDRQRAQQRARDDIKEAYNQQLADIRESEQTKLAEIQSSQAAQVQQTKDALNEQTTLRKAALAEEYRLTQETEAAKLEVFQQALNTVVGMKGLQTGGYGGTPLPMGGSLNPNGYGVQTPLPMTNSSVTNNNTPVNININGGNTDKVAQTIKQVLGV